MKKLFTLLLFACSFTVKAQIITTIAGCGSCSAVGDGITAISAQIGFASFVILDSFENYYFGSNQYKIRVVTSSGIINTIAGSGISGYSGDIGPATAAKISLPAGIAFDTHGNLYIADIYNNAIRKVDKLSGYISTIAGNGTSGFSGDLGPATDAQLNLPQGIAVDKHNNIYFGDGGNYRVRKIDAAGVITTIAGNGVFASTGDGGPASGAELAAIESLRFDTSDNLYICESEKIRKIDPKTGIISCVAGTGVPGYSGDGGPATSAQLLFAVDVLPDKLGNFYISDGYNHVIRKVDNSGIINTIAGDNTSGYSGDGGLATSAQLNNPRGIALDACNNLLIVDAQNGRIRKILQPVFTKPTISITSPSTSKAGVTVTVTATVANAGSSYIIHWLNKGAEFATTTISTVTYTKSPGIDTITARVVSTATYGCYDSTTSVPHIIAAPSKVSMLQGAVIDIYPNPANNILHIDNLKSSTTYRLLNILGAETQQGNLKPGNNVIPLNVPTGVYLLELTDDAGKRQKTKLIKQ